MKKAGQQWFAKLKRYASECRENNPFCTPDTLTKAEQYQFSIIGGSIENWLEDIGPTFYLFREVFYKRHGTERDPYLVFTSNMIGLVAAKEILGEEQERVVYLLEEEFQTWRKENPDEKYKWHIHYKSYFQDPIKPGTDKQLDKKYPVSPKCKYWFHDDGTMWGPLVGKGAVHLWKWNGKKPKLLKEAWNHWVA